MRRFLGVFGVAALLVASVQPVGAATPARGTDPLQRPDLRVAGKIEGAKSASGRLARSDQDLINRTDGAMVNVMIKYDLDAVASYTGGVKGLAATSPSVTGHTLKDGGSTVGNYKLYLQGQSRMIRTSILRKIPGVQLRKDYLVAYGGVSARIPANQAKNLLAIKGVAAVQLDAENHPTALDSANFVGATAVWPSLGGSSKAGMGTKIGVLDTGIWPENPMLADNAGLPAPTGGPFQCNFGTSGQPGDAPFVCNNKMAGAYAFTDTNLSVNGAPPAGYFCNAGGTACSARDGEGHGTHTSTTAAGDKINSAVLLGVERGPASGIAPGAAVIMYRVCIQDSCYESDSVDAVQQAIEDDVDVINFSIGGGADPYSDPVELAFLDAYASGIAVNASAGNSGPGAATAEHGSPWETTVGASTLDRSYESTLHLTADGGATLNLTGVTITEGITSPTPVIMASDAPYSDELCNSDPGSGAFTGKVVVCKRGTNGRIDKGHNVYLGDGEGMILYNQSAGVTDLESDNHFLPAIQVQYAGDAVATFVSSHTNVRATWAPGAATPSQGDVMASFSSRGPEGDFLKPDVTAPGVQILAGNTPQPASVDSGRPGENFQAIAGTSMSSPHAAGVSLLLKAAHPSWTPGQIKSALMTSAVQSVVKEDGVTPADPFDRGAGSIRANRAINPTVTFEATAPDFYGSASDPFGRIDLNIASVDAPNMPGKITTRRTAHNVTNSTQTLHITASAPNNSKITVSPSTLTIAPFGNATFQITIDGSKLEDGWYFGQITLDPVKAGALNAVLPVAFNHQPGNVSLENSCDGPTETFVADSVTIAKGTSANCEVTVTNFTPQDAAVAVKVKAPNTDRLIIRNWSDGEKKGNGFLWNGVLDPALPPPVISMTSPSVFGFTDLVGAGVDPESSFGNDFGDETLINYDLTGVEVYYGDIAYNTVAVTSDGYLKFGEGDSADLNFVPQDMPDPNPPNNVLAPFWTDFDMSGDSAPTVDGGDMYIGYDGCFLYFEWYQVPIWGTDVTRTFEATIGTKDCMDALNGGDDFIEFDYDAGDNGASTNGTPMNVGAEDALGVTAADLGVDSTGTQQPDDDGYFIETGVTIPGGSKTITYDAYGKRTGNFDVKALMTSDVTQGTAVQIVKVHVVNP